LDSHIGKVTTVMMLS